MLELGYSTSGQSEDDISVVKKEENDAISKVILSFVLFVCTRMHLRRACFVRASILIISKKLRA